MTNRSASWGLFFVALSALLFGSIGVTTRGIFAVAPTNALSITLWRALIALPAIFILSILVLRRELFAIRATDLRLMILAGLMMAMYQVTFVIAVRLVNVTIATIIGLLESLTGALLAALLFNEHLDALGLLGAVLLLAAMVIVFRTNRQVVEAMIE